MFRSGEQYSFQSPIDIHTHLREPGGDAQETIATGTLAALKGGYQMVSDMPNNAAPHQTWTRDRAIDKRHRIHGTAYADVGIHTGVDFTDPDFAEIPYLIPLALSTKFYMGKTTNNTLELTLEHVRPYADAWIQQCREAGKILPIFLHAEGDIGKETAEYILGQEHPVHWCHVATDREAYYASKFTRSHPELFTAGVTPHHLTMTRINADFQQGWNGARMVPKLGEERDHEALLYGYNKEYLQVLETDHAPHTAAAKLKAETENPAGEIGEDCTTCYGVSGIEHVLGIMAAMAQRGQTTMERVENSLYAQPLRALRLERLKDTVLNSTTTIEFGPRIIEEGDIVGKSSNTPYINWTAGAKVVSVERDGKTLYDEHTEPRQGGARFIHQAMELEAA